MTNTKYIELSYCDMPCMLQTLECIKHNNQILYTFGKYAFIKVLKGINRLKCLYPSYKLQVFYEEKAKELFNSDLSNEEKELSR